MRRIPAILFLTLAATFTATAGGGSVIPEIPQGFEAPKGTDRLHPTPQDRTNLPGTSRSDRASADKGVAWLLEQQRKDGGWAAGGWGGADAQSDVATTAYVIQALRRAGGAPNDAILTGAEFVVRAVENAPEGPMLATPQGTQPQGKLGSTVDTYYAASVLGELLEADVLPSALRARANAAHDVVLGKIQKAQAGNGSFSQDGWAPVLATSVAMDALNDAARLGKKVDKDVLAKADSYNASLVAGTGAVDTTAAAGVPLYAVAGALAANDEAARRAEREGQGSTASAKAARQAAASSTAQVTGASADQLIQGFGSAGGEEMLSYQMVSDTLAKKGGKEWDGWSTKIGDYLRSTQNADGSWAGHHCITSAVFVTAGAVMTLSAGGPDAPRG